MDKDLERRLKAGGISWEGRKKVTRDSMKAECDVNRIVAKAASVGQLPFKPGAVFGDFTKVTDFQTALASVSRAQASFLSLPANVRRRFENDPGKFLAFVSDPKNGEELVKMGLAVKKAAVVPPQPAVTAPVAPPAAAPAAPVKA